MNRQNIPLGRIMGIPIGLDLSWFLIFALLTWTLAVGYYPAEFKNWPTVEYWLVGAVTAIMLFVSVLLHELGHSVVALRYKVPVRRITLFIFGGVAEISSEPPSAGAEFWIAIAGPAVSFALAIIFTLVQPAVTAVAPLFALVKYLAYINGVLGLFNLIPGFPLDGGRVFRAIVWGVGHNLHQATTIAGNLGRLIGFLFIGVGVWQMFAGNFINGLWITFIGWFLESAAGAQIIHQRMQDILAGHQVSDIMSRGYTAVQADTPLARIMEDHVLSSGRRSFIVEQGGQTIGLLTLYHIKEMPQSEWPTTTAAEAMVPLLQMKRIRPDMQLWPAMEEMDRDGVDQLTVMAESKVMGMLRREDIISYLRTLQELNGQMAGEHQ